MKLKTKDILQEDFNEKQIDDLKFEDGMEILESLVREVESGELPLDASIIAYERGKKVLNKMEKLLDGAEKKLQILNKENKKETMKA